MLRVKIHLWASLGHSHLTFEIQKTWITYHQTKVRQLEGIGHKKGSREDIRYCADKRGSTCYLTREVTTPQEAGGST